MWANTDHAILATIDAIKSICQLLIVKKVVSTAELAHSFEHQGKGYLQKGDPDDVAVMVLLLQYLGWREEAERLMREPPQGSA